jgi:soluble lytic murein transglycosylase
MRRGTQSAVLVPLRLPRFLPVLLAAGLALAPAVPAAPPAAPARLAPELRDRWQAALAAYRASDWRTAARELGALAAAPSPIAEYALYLQADSLGRGGDPAAARAPAQLALDRVPDGPLAAPALLLAAQQASRAGDEGAAAGFYRRFLDRAPEHPEAVRARLAMGQSLIATGQPAEAARALRAVWMQAAAAPEGESAAQLLRQLGSAAPPPTMRERLERAERLLGGPPAAASAEAEALIADAPPVDLVHRALRVVSEAARRAGKFDEAVRTVDRALILGPAERRPAWLIERARLLQPRQPAQAIATLDRVAREYPQSPEVPSALALKAQIQESGAQPGEAEPTYLRIVADFADDEEAPRALWRLGWLSWFRGAHREAAERWSRVASPRAGQALREGSVYWVGRAHEARGDTEAADRAWAPLLSRVPRSYYGLLTAARVRGRAAPASATSAVAPLPAEPAELLRADVRFAKAEALRAVGLPDFADGELDEIARRAGTDLPRLYAVSAAFASDARYHLALRILRREFVPFVRGGDPGLPRAFWELFYPLGWRSEIIAAASRTAVDPFLAAAVVREESSYDPRAQSRRGARGLMQLMLETARPLARSRGIDFAAGEVLWEPGPNVEMGTAYLAQQLRDFPDPRLAIAAYNAGPRRVREWWAARRSDDLEVFVEQMPYDETRFYVKRVMLSWQEYRRLYGGGAS